MILSYLAHRLLLFCVDTFQIWNGGPCWRETTSLTRCEQFLEWFVRLFIMEVRLVL